MFVSETRRQIAALLKTGLTMNEIAHRLDLARSTVGYHAQALREAHNPSSPRVPARRGWAPVGAPSQTRERVRALLAAGHTRAAIAQMLEVARSTVTYHAKLLDEPTDGRCARRYDWDAIKRFYEAGHSVAECRARFGFNRQAWHGAVLRGLITPRPARTPLEELLVVSSRHNRNHLKQRLFDAGIKARTCESCGLTEWRGRNVPLSLHHVNGDRYDNRLENLQILCANCHGQTDTWAGRNIPRRAHARAPTAPARLPPPVDRAAATPPSRPARSTR